ncbi:MAG: hypothetical protein GY941_03140, partial [Planctomycetes bacterium]|nr:hypothetical protein [Planctomycetota bacterium]
TFSVSFKKLSENILKDTCDKLIETDSEAIVTTCPNCIFQLSKSIKEIPIYHLIELIEEALC